MLHRLIEVRPSSIDGSGLFTTGLIRTGEIIWRETEGTLKFTRADIESWPPEVRARFLLIAYQVDEGIWVGYSPLANSAADKMPMDPAMLMNHSCDPSCWFNGDEEMVARRDVFPGEEITYDYATSETEYFEMECRCQSPECRKIVTGNDSNLPKFRQRYSGHMLSYIQRRASFPER